MRVIRLCEGIGVEGQAHCVMAATSVIAGEKFSDRPSCVDPAITMALVAVNDACPSDEIRERLLGHLPWMIIGTRSPDFEVMVKRVQMFFDYGMEIARRYPEDMTIQDRIARASFHRLINFADARKTVSHVACVVHRAALVNLKNNLKSGRKWEDEVKKFIDFIESEIIPVYTTMPIEPGFAIDKLVTVEVE